MNQLSGKADQKLSHADRSLTENLLHYVSIVLRYKWLIIIITGITTIAVLAYCVYSVVLPPDKSPLPNIYVARATITIQRGSDLDLASTILSALGVERQPAESVGTFDTGELVLQVLRSRAIIDRIVGEFDIVGRFHIEKQARTRSRVLLQSKLAIDYNRASASISVAFQDTDPVLASNIVNRILALTSEWFVQNRGTSNRRQTQLLEEKIKEVQADISTLEERQKELQEKYSVMTAEEVGTKVALDAQRKIFDTLSHQYEVLKLTPEETPVFQVLEPAEVPEVKAGPQRSTIIIRAMLVSFVVSVALAFVLDGIRRIRRDPRMRDILRGRL